MRSLTIVLLASFLTFGAIPLAAADETAPDCEDDQPSIGYGSAGAAAFRDLMNATNHPADLFVCEGEHWDGQDTVQPDQSPTCNPSVNAVPDDLFVGMCMGTDPNGHESANPLNPLAFRAGSTGDESYAAFSIGFVGRAAVYSGDGVAAVYLRDNTPGNALATVVSAPRITQGFVDENDCSQAVYQAGAMNPPSDCGRDNTAITVYYTLP